MDKLECIAWFEVNCTFGFKDLIFLFSPGKFQSLDEYHLDSFLREGLLKLMKNMLGLSRGVFNFERL